MTNLEVAAIEVDRARRELDRKRAALAEARTTYNARLEHLASAVKAERRGGRRT